MVQDPKHHWRFMAERSGKVHNCQDNSVLLQSIVGVSLNFEGFEINPFPNSWVRLCFPARHVSARHVKTEDHLVEP